MILPFKEKSPVISPDAFIAPTAVIIGDVKIASRASIWYGAVLRGDLAPIRIGANSNVQDNCTIHTDVEKPAIIGEDVTVGHNSVVHGCRVEKRCLIGMGAVILSGAHLKTGTVVAAGALIKEGQVAGPCQLLAGIPAVVKKQLPEHIMELLKRPMQEYLELSKNHQDTLNALE